MPADAKKAEPKKGTNFIVLPVVLVLW